ncbi:AraC family transcriptional regulator [Anaeromicropila populeti]|uniref:AraC-type DNA-binding protein n=1 Tax=Anaeromicropila populeti TaxID=37658 RepID=A0A1I6IDR6_9FIRM|nr:helix-turn-helix domain-containing protein [Anaeromicropila populeti]SFR64836.1 AraC-type DNA-binding protein [Anaeromicropila populeti]
MALQKCTLNLDRSGRELRPHGTIEFPCAGYSSKYTSRTADEIPWHYHEEIEMIYIMDGNMQVQIPGKTFHMKEGEGIFINSGILHRGVAEPCCEIHSFVFSATLVAGNEKSVFAKKYIEPLSRCPVLDGCLLSPIEEWQNKILSHFSLAFDAMYSDKPGYEFLVREHLSQSCILLYFQYEKEINRSHVETQPDKMRIRKMIDFIHEHYMENLMLSQIAEAADIGQRECLRCFQRVIQTSPMQYLLKYRIMQGASMLLNNSEDSIADISIQCGFDSPSNFSKMFKRFFECTPKEYRKNYFNIY